MNEESSSSQKVVKSQIGKILAIVIAVVVVAGIAGYLLQTSYFKGTICGTREVCGNGVVCPQTEECDDGNNNQNDACNNQCEEQFPICHYNSSGSYNVLWVDEHAVDGLGGNDHSAHVNDIIPIADMDNDGDYDEDDCFLAASSAAGDTGLITNDPSYLEAKEAITTTDLQVEEPKEVITTTDLTTISEPKETITTTDLTTISEPKEVITTTSVPITEEMRSL